MALLLLLVTFGLLDFFVPAFEFENKIENMLTKKILSSSDKKEIVEAIIQAEKNTSGEIHVHVENNNNMKPLERAQQLFFELGIDATQQQNGVLFFICGKSKTLTIIGDKGINDKVDANFWNKTKMIVLEYFKQGLFKKGLVLGIEQAGKQLQQFFPSEKENSNELSNEISNK